MAIVLNLESSQETFEQLETRDVVLPTFGGTGFSLSNEEIKTLNGDERILEQLRTAP
jgi:hypothetical protein